MDFTFLAPDWRVHSKVSGCHDEGVRIHGQGFLRRVMIIYSRLKFSAFFSGEQKKWMDRLISWEKYRGSSAKKGFSSELRVVFPSLQMAESNSYYNLTAANQVRSRCDSLGSMRCCCYRLKRPPAIVRQSRPGLIGGVTNDILTCIVFVPKIWLPDN